MEEKVILAALLLGIALCFVSAFTELQAGLNAGIVIFLWSGALYGYGRTIKMGRADPKAARFDFFSMFMALVFATLAIFHVLPQQAVWPWVIIGIFSGGPVIRNFVVWIGSR